MTPEYAMHCESVSVQRLMSDELNCWQPVGLFSQRCSIQSLAADVSCMHGGSTDLDADLAAWKIDCSMDNTLGGSFPPDLDLECKSGSSLTL